MSTTPNLNLILFNGNDTPSHELFNQNNEIIDNILVNARTHNHDGVNSSKINASNVVFDKGDTTLTANNLNDAVIEVFQEADSKIKWITDTIGPTPSGTSNPDTKVSDIVSDFSMSKDVYFNAMKEATLFKVQGPMPDNNASINEIASAINNTCFKDATATKDDMLTEATALTKYGITETGTISPIDYLMVKPSSTNDITISKGMYKDLYLVPFTESNPALHIKKGCSILGIQGLLSEHGSNGWDIGENIDKSKLTPIHKDSCYLKEIYPMSTSSLNRASFVSVKHPISFTVDNKSIMAQHFKLNYNGEIIAYTSDFRDYLVKKVSVLAGSNYGQVSRNSYNNLNAVQIVQHPHASYLISLNSGYITIVNLTTFNTVYTKKVLDGTLYGIVVNKDNETDLSKVVVYGKNNYNYYSTVLKPTNTEDTDAEWSSITYVLGPDIYYSLVDENGRQSVEIIPKYTTTTTSTTKLYNAQCCFNSDTLVLYAGDKIKINRLLKNYDHMELTASIPLGGSTARLKFTINDTYSDVYTETTTISSTATQSYLYICESESDENIVTLECLSGIIRIHGMKVNDDGTDYKERLFSKEWGFMGFNLVPMGQLTIDNSNDVGLVWAGSITDLEQAESTARVGVSQLDLTQDLLEKIPKIRRSLSVDNMYLGAYKTVDTNHTCLSFMSEYDGYLFGTFPNKEVSNVAVTGLRYYKFNRKLVKIGLSVDRYGKLAINKEKESYGLHYRLFKPMFINHLGEVIGLEQGCTNNKFTYLAKLNGNLACGVIDENWSEDYYRTAEEEMKIIDDGTSLNTLRMFNDITRCYNSNGSISNTKLLGNVYKSYSENYDNSTADMGTSIDGSKQFFNGFISVFNPVHKINSIRN